MMKTTRRRSRRKKKDYSDDEDYKPFANIAPLATAPPSPIPVAGVKVNVSLI